MYTNNRGPLLRSGRFHQVVSLDAVGLGATGDWLNDQYQALAKSQAAASPATYVFVGLGLNGSPITVTPAASADEVATLYDAASQSTQYSYGAMFQKGNPSADPSGLMDEFLHVGIATKTFSFIKDKWPWLLLAGGVIAGGLYFSRNRKKKGAPRRRTRPLWRRRITTTWR